MEQIKCVVVGDGAVGKTSLLFSYTKNEFSQVHVPTIFDNYACQVMVNGAPVNLSFWDTAGQEDYDRLRPLSYADSDVFLLCFSLTRPTSLQNIATRWVPELQAHSPNTPIVLVGTKRDLKKCASHNENPVSANDTKLAYDEKGLQMMKKLQLAGYYECSALTQEGLKETFDGAVRTALRSKKKGTIRKQSERRRPARIKSSGPLAGCTLM